jgi:hypothetical protein
MMHSLVRRLHREDDGYALVIAILLLSVMMVLMVVSLDAANGSLKTVSQGSEWSKTLTVAEAGVNDVITLLGQSRTSSNPCGIGTGATCSGGGGEYQVSWTPTATGGIQVTSKGYFPTMTTPRYTREVQVTYEPVPTFKYALFSQDALSIKNNPTISGDIYASGAITVDNNVTICGGIVSANGTITLGQNDQVLTTYAPSNCSGKTGLVWAGGSIVGALGVVVAGNATASGPSGTNCNSGSSSYSISTMTVQGSGGATACGKISSVTAATGGTHAGTATTPPAVQTMPAYLFDPNNYPSLVCYPTSVTCGTNTATLATVNFNTYVTTHLTDLSGEFAIWQRNPTKDTYLNLDNLSNISGDVTIVTNAPINFGNTTTITTSATTAQMTVISLYQPPSGTTCQDGTGDCSIYGNNNIKFDSGSPTDPNDGIVGLLYTTGKLSFKNRNNNAEPWEGALYANSMDMKNGFDIVYNARIERTLGFGSSLQQVLWQEINL